MARGVRYGEDVRRAVFEAIMRGESASAAGRAAGVSSPQTVARWCRAWGISLIRNRRGGADMSRVRIEVAPRGPRSSPRARLTHAERTIIADRAARGASCRAIGREPGVAHTTVSRELRDASHLDARGRYDPERAHAAALAARSRPRARKLDENPALRGRVVLLLGQRWSPEQVSGRLRLECGGDPMMCVSHETIYQALYARGRGELRHEVAVEDALRSGRGGRVPQSGLPGGGTGGRGRRSWIGAEAHISMRPPEAGDRAVPGHWEGDLIVFGRGCLVTLAERATRLVLIGRLDNHESATVCSKLVEMVSDLPGALLRSLSWDQGVEMARVADFEAATDLAVYFCDPHSPWQRGTNENANGLIRQYFPRGTRFSDITDEAVRGAQDDLNGRPRKCLGFRTPAEAMAEFLEAGEVVQS